MKITIQVDEILKAKIQNTSIGRKVTLLNNNNPKIRVKG